MPFAEADQLPSVCAAQPVVAERNLKSLFAMLKKEKAIAGMAIFKNNNGKKRYFLNFANEASAKEMAKKIAAKPYYLTSKKIQHVKGKYYLCLTAAEINKLYTFRTASKIQSYSPLELVEQFQQKFPGLSISRNAITLKSGKTGVSVLQTGKSANRFKYFLQYYGCDFALAESSGLDISLDELRKVLSKLEQFDSDQARGGFDFEQQLRQKFSGLVSIENEDGDIELLFKDKKSAAAFGIFLQYHGYRYYQDARHEKNPRFFSVPLAKLKEFDINQAYLHDTDLHQQKDLLRNFLHAAEVTEVIAVDPVSWQVKFDDPFIVWIIKQIIPELVFHAEADSKGSIYLKLSSQLFYDVYEQLRADALAFYNLIHLCEAYKKKYNIDIKAHDFAFAKIAKELSVSSLKHNFNYLLDVKQDSALTENKIRLAVPVTLLPKQKDELAFAAAIINRINAKDRQIITLNNTRKAQAGYVEVELPAKTERQYDIDEVISVTADIQQSVNADALLQRKRAFNTLLQLSSVLKCPPGFLNDGESLRVLDDQLLDMLRFVLNKETLEKKIKWNALSPEELQTLSRLILYKSPQSQYTFLMDNSAAADYKKNVNQVQQQIAILEQAKVPGSCEIYVKQRADKTFLIALKSKKIVLDQKKQRIYRVDHKLVDKRRSAFVIAEKEGYVDEINPTRNRNSTYNLIHDLNTLGALPVVDLEGVTILEQPIWDELKTVNKTIDDKRKKKSWTEIQKFKIPKTNQTYEKSISEPDQSPKCSRADCRQAKRQLEAMSDILNRLTDKLYDLNHEGIKNRFDAEKSDRLADLIAELYQAFDAARNDYTKPINSYAKEFLELLNASIAEKEDNPLYTIRTTGTVFLFFSNFNPHVQKSSTVREIKAAIKAMEKVVSVETAAKLLSSVS